MVVISFTLTAQREGSPLSLPKRTSTGMFLIVRVTGTTVPIDVQIGTENLWTHGLLGLHNPSQA